MPIRSRLDDVRAEFGPDPYPPALILIQTVDAGILTAEARQGYFFKRSRRRVLPNETALCSDEQVAFAITQNSPDTITWQACRV